MSDDYGLKVVNKYGDVLAGSDFFIGSVTELLTIPGNTIVKIPRALDRFKGSNNFLFIPISSRLYLGLDDPSYIQIQNSSEYEGSGYIIRGL